MYNHTSVTKETGTSRLIKLKENSEPLSIHLNPGKTWVSTRFDNNYQLLFSCLQNGITVVRDELLTK